MIVKKWFIPLLFVGVSFGMEQDCNDGDKNKDLVEDKEKVVDLKDIAMGPIFPREVLYHILIENHPIKNFLKEFVEDLKGEHDQLQNEGDQPTREEVRIGLVQRVHTLFHIRDGINHLESIRCKFDGVSMPYRFECKDKNGEYRPAFVFKEMLLLNHLQDVIESGKNSLDLLPDGEPESERLDVECQDYFSLLPEGLQYNLRQYVRSPISRRFAENVCSEGKDEEK